jgi:hypothetical protein
MDMSIVPIEIPATGGRVQHLLLNLVHLSPQRCPDAHGVDYGLLGDMVDVDYALRFKESTTSLLVLKPLTFA